MAFFVSKGWGSKKDEMNVTEAATYLLKDKSHIEYGKCRKNTSHKHPGICEAEVIHSLLFALRIRVRDFSDSA